MLTLHEGTPIRTADGDTIGDIDRLVVEPSGHRVTHAVVRKGVFFPDDRVIPVDALEMGDDDTLTLRSTVDADSLPAFEESHYVDLGEMPGDATDRSGRAIAWAYPLTPVAGYPLYPTFPSHARVETERNVPDASMIVDQKTHVRTADGTDVGVVREIGIDDDGALTHVTVDPGWFQEERVIPAHWIREVDENMIEIAVPAASLSDA